MYKTTINSKIQTNLIAKSMTTNYNGLLPVWNNPWNISAYYGFPENSTPKNIPYCSIRRLPHLLQFKLYKYKRKEKLTISITSWLWLCKLSNLLCNAEENHASQINITLCTCNARTCLNIMAPRSLYYSIICAVLWTAHDINLDLVYKQVDELGQSQSLVPFLTATSQARPILCSPSLFSVYLVLSCTLEPPTTLLAVVCTGDILHIAIAKFHTLWTWGPLTETTLTETTHKQADIATCMHALLLSNVMQCKKFGTHQS